ncbi:hypothetical protein KAW18_11050 [candidate division WOR-3 bacterium]|nr:hypothetical protein [candidate division WOR-3 bacterium]
MLLTQWTDLSEREWQKEKERIRKIRDKHVNIPNQRIKGELKQTNLFE